MTHPSDRFRWVTVLCTITTLGTAAKLPAAQPGACQATASVTAVSPALDGVYRSTYVPPFVGGSSGGQGSQAIAVTADRAAGVEAALSCFPLEHVGIQVLGSYAGHSVSGAGDSPYAVHLEWVARQPPDYVPRTYSLDDTTPWPATSGSMRQVTLSLNAIGRTSPSRPIRAAVSGGLSYFNWRGSFGPLALTSYWLGGHSVLFSEEYRLSMRAEPGSSLGLNVGGTFEYWVARRAAVSIDYRVFRAASVSSAVSVAEILNGADIVMQSMSLADLQRALHPAPLEVDPSFSRLAVGVAIGF